jgi:hypothetical protein
MRPRRAGGMDQVVQCLPSKLKAMSSNLSTSKKKIMRKEAKAEVIQHHQRSPVRNV